MTYPEVTPTVIFNAGLSRSVNNIEINAEGITEFLRENDLSDEAINDLAIYFLEEDSEDLIKSRKHGKRRSAGELTLAGYFPQFKKIEVYLNSILGTCEINNTDPNEELQSCIVHELGHAIEDYHVTSSEKRDFKYPVVLGVGALAIGASNYLFKTNEIESIMSGLACGASITLGYNIYKSKRAPIIENEKEQRVESFTEDNLTKYPELVTVDAKECSTALFLKLYKNVFGEELQL